jgi:adhesin transport system membrane fusion protein
MNDMQTDSAGQETGAGQETNRLDDLLAHHPLPSWRLVAWPVMILLALLFGWAQYAQLDEVAVAMGEVVPQGQVKLIQHLEGGIIKKIHVNDGDSVKAGDTLVQLDLSTSGINRKELQVRLDSQLLVRLRLNAEAESTELKFPEDLYQPAKSLTY